MRDDKFALGTPDGSNADCVAVCGNMVDAQNQHGPEYLMGLGLRVQGIRFRL